MDSNICAATLLDLTEAKLKVRRLLLGLSSRWRLVMAPHVGDKDVGVVVVASDNEQLFRSHHHNGLCLGVC